ncbi:MAG TPA: trypsin-like peptidase domain-containing protein [Bacteriovoracaceae bacterium]|nr:trypsin-like peptidase domain-containing protein [Bacteriovoracaceae bacterium]
MKILRLIPGFACLLALMCCMMSCGKKEQSSNAQGALAPATDAVMTSLEEYLSKQLLVCAEGEVCPNYITKIVVFDSHKNPRTCTGFLVSDDTVATSTSCLPQLLRLKDQDCSTEVTFFFPKTNNLPAQRVGCSKVLQVSELGNKDAPLWRDDVAFLKLEKSITTRRTLAFHREGIENHREYTFWGIDQIDDKTGIIRRQDCEGIHGSWINPLASKLTSPNMIFAGCVLKNGNTGSPILDARGRVRGMVSEMMDPKLREELESTGFLTQKLKPMFHATNFSCAPTIFDAAVEDERECTKVIDQGELSRARRDMLNERNDFFESKRKQLEERISSENRFMNFTVTLVADGDIKRAVITPRCFKDVQGWIYVINTSRGNYTFEVSFPEVGMRRTMDAEGRLGAIETDHGKLNYFIQFSAKQLRNSGHSDVYFWNNNSSQTFKGITDTCL